MMCADNGRSDVRSKLPASLRLRRHKSHDPWRIDPSSCGHDDRSTTRSTSQKRINTSTLTLFMLIAVVSYQRMCFCKTLMFFFSNKIISTIVCNHYCLMPQNCVLLIISPLTNYVVCAIIIIILYEISRSIQQ